MSRLAGRLCVALYFLVLMLEQRLRVSVGRLEGDADQERGSASLL